MSDERGILSEQGSRFLHERMSPMVKVAKARMFLDWLEFKCQTKDPIDRPSAAQILREFKRITGFSSYNEANERQPGWRHDSRPTSGD